MDKLGVSDAALMSLVHAIVRDDAEIVSQLLTTSPALAAASLKQGASRRGAKAYYLAECGYYLYAGASALHAAAAAYQTESVRQLISMDADVRARNRRGAEPIHAAVVGMPGSRMWNPPAQGATVRYLIGAGADPNAVDMDGVTPLHRAVRTRCAAAVQALLEGGADPQRRNGNGSTAMLLATQNTGRGGSGSTQAKAQQQEIVRLLAQQGATQ